MSAVYKKRRLQDGLYGRFFNSYFSDNMSNLSSPNHASPPRILTSISSFGVSTTQTWMIRGYFLSDTTSSAWQFRTNSDDASYVWIGSNSEATDTTLNTGNAIVDNGGVHGAQTRTSGNISLVDGTLYPFAVVVGNNTGPGTLTLEWSVDGGSWQSDGTGYFFRNPYAPNGYNLE